VKTPEPNDQFDPNVDDVEMREKRAARERFEMEMFGNGKNVCLRCGREKKLENLKHTRLYGYLCVCGSDEWSEDE